MQPSRSDRHRTFRLIRDRAHLHLALPADQAAQSETLFHSLAARFPSAGLLQSAILRTAAQELAFKTRCAALTDARLATHIGEAAATLQQDRPDLDPATLPARAYSTALTHPEVSAPLTAQHRADLNFHLLYHAARRLQEK